MSRFKEAIVTIILGLMTSLPLIRQVRETEISLRVLIYLASLGFYHWAEYLYVCIYHYGSLNFDSKEYQFKIHRLFD